MPEKKSSNKSTLPVIGMGNGHAVHPYDPTHGGAIAWCARCGTTDPTNMNVGDCVLIESDCQCVYWYGGSKRQCPNQPLPGSRYCADHPDGSWPSDASFNAGERLPSLTLHGGPRKGE